MGGAFSTAVEPNCVVVPVVSDPCAFCSQYRQRLCFAFTRASAAALKPFLDPQLLITTSRDCNDAMSHWLAAYRAAATGASHRDKDRRLSTTVLATEWRIDRLCERLLEPRQLLVTLVLRVSYHAATSFDPIRALTLEHTPVSLHCHASRWPAADTAALHLYMLSAFAQRSLQ